MAAQATVIRDSVMHQTKEKQRKVNPELSLEEAAKLPGCVSSHDMGTRNYTHVTFAPAEPPKKAKNERRFPCPIERILSWKKYHLEGDSIMYYASHLVKLLEADPVNRANRVRWPYAEAQIAPKAKHMLAISATLMSYYETRKAVTGSAWPERMISVGAQSKFAYFMLGTPEGDDNYANRKRLSSYIVEYLMVEWKNEGLIEPAYTEFYLNKNVTGADKRDDYADCMLQGITEELVRQRVAPTWPALNRLYGWIKRTDSHFAGPGKGNWPLAFNAESEAALLALMKKVDRTLARAMRNYEKLIARFAGLKRKKTPAEETQLLNAAKADIEKARDACKAIYEDLNHCIDMIGARAYNKETRALVRTAERKEAEERKQRFMDYLAAAKANGVHVSEREKQLKGEKMQYLMELEQAAISREDAARRAYLQAAMMGEDEEMEYDIPEPSAELLSAMAASTSEAVPTKRSRPNPVALSAGAGGNRDDDDFA